MRNSNSKHRVNRQKIQANENNEDNSNKEDFYLKLREEIPIEHKEIFKNLVLMFTMFIFADGDLPPQLYFNNAWAAVHDEPGRSRDLIISGIKELNSLPTDNQYRNPVNIELLEDKVFSIPNNVLDYLFAAASTYAYPIRQAFNDGTITSVQEESTVHLL